MLNVLFNYRLGDGYSLGLQSTVECLSEIPLSGITLSSDSVEVAIGETAKVTATPVPANATNKNLEWEIADPKIATVDTSGNITGVAIGETTLTVYGEDRTISATCSVSVKARHTLYSNSVDFGNYDYSGNPNLLSNVTNDSWTAEGVMKVTAVDDYLELVKDTTGRYGTAKIYNIPALRSDSQYTTSLEFYLKSGTSAEDLKNVILLSKQLIQVGKFFIVLFI
ncbi:Ig-like domain-containing protein [Enterococcus faecium]|nr:Ig-like domain-containing protein [Enterococcus faecium]